MENNNNIIIRNFNELLQPYLHQNAIISGTTIKPLTSAGENYGSQMLAVEVKLQNKKLDHEEILHLVAKMCPPTALLKETFNTSITFKNENAIYQIIVPTLRAFQKEQGASSTINFFAKCFGARISLNLEADVVDDDAVLLLENLKHSGFEVVDSMKGFNLEMTKLLLKDMAVFHAVPIAMKLLKPNLFKSKILPHLRTRSAFATLSDKGRAAAIDFLAQTVKSKPECEPFIEDVKNSLQMNLKNLCNPPTPREPFATISHNDYWVNNTMIKFEKNKPVKNKMVDFQVIDYGSPGKDIVFMLFSSVQHEVLTEHYDDLLELYYSTFIKTLQELKCDTTPFTFELLLEEINYSARTMEFFHVMMMLKHILAIKDKVKELADLTEEDFLSEEQVSNEFRKKAPEIAFEFIKRKWI